MSAFLSLAFGTGLLAGMILMTEGVAGFRVFSLPDLVLFALLVMLVWVSSCGWRDIRLAVSAALGRALPDRDAVLRAAHAFRSLRQACLLMGGIVAVVSFMTMLNTLDDVTEVPRGAARAIADLVVGLFLAEVVVAPMEARLAAAQEQALAGWPRTGLVGVALSGGMVLLAIFVVLFALSSSLRTFRADEARNFYREGIEAYRAGAYLLAREKLTSALHLDMQNREIGEMLARVQVVGGAIALATGDTQEKVMIRKGAASYIEGDPVTAVNVLQSALAQAPADDRLRALLRKIAREVKPGAPAAPPVPGLTWKEKKLAKALDLFYRGEYEQVVGACQDVLAVDPGDITAMKRMGSAYWMLERKDKAREMWRKVLTLKPDDRDVPELLKQR